MTSHDVVAAARRVLGVRQIGHTGTLDPFATGLLVLVVGRATRLARFVEAGRKTYEAAARLGQRTATDDPTGEPVGPAYAGPWPDEAGIRAALAGLEGRVRQQPPAYSAKKVGGRRSHALARAGAAVPLAPVEVEVDRLELLAWVPPEVAFRATVGPGTYVRAVARDLGEALGTGAHLTRLRRTRVGPFRVEDAVPLDRLERSTPLIEPRALLAGATVVELEAAEGAAVRHGRAVGHDAAAGATAALVEAGRLLAVAQGREGRWQPVVVLEGP